MASHSNHKRYYNDILNHPELLRWELSVYKKLFHKNLTSIVDLGCGTGEFLEMAKEMFPKVLGVDMNDYAIQTCKKKGIPAVKADVNKTKLKSNSFDVVRSKEVLEHVQDAEKFILECKRILKKNGYLVIHVPSQWSALYPITNFWDDYTHVRPFTKRGVLRLLTEIGFTIVYTKGYTVGRNIIESLLGKIIEKIFPFNWFVIAQINNV